MKKVFILFSFIMSFCLNETNAQVAAKISPVGTLVIPDSPIQNIYLVDLSNFQAKSANEYEQMFSMVWKRWAFISYTIDYNNKTATFTLDRTSNRINWTSVEWNLYLNK